MMSEGNGALARRAQQLAESGDYEGFSAVGGALIREATSRAQAIETLKLNGEFRVRITKTCREAWRRKHTRSGA